MSRSPSKRNPAQALAPQYGLMLEGPRTAIEAIAACDAIGGLVLGPPHAARARRLYFDTESLALANAGLTLSVAAGGERFVHALVEQCDPPVAGFFERSASAARIASPDPDLTRSAPGSLGARAHTLCVGGELIAQLEEECACTTRRIALERATLDASFELGEARVAAGAIPIARIALVLKSGAPAALFRAAFLLLEKHPSLRPAREDMARLVLRLGGEPPAIAAPRPIALAKDATLDALIGAVLAECLRGIVHGEPSARIERETEGLHQLRVAVRRLRSALRMFREELPRERADWLRAALEPLSDALGAARDCDVFLEQIAACEASGAAGLAALRTRVASERSEAFAELERLLDSPERARLDLELGLLAFGADWRDPARAERLALPAAQAARELAARADHRARKAGRGFAQLAPESVHRLRLRAKAARYAMDLLAPLLPAKRARRYVRRARALQDALGVESDAARTRVLIERFGGASASSGAVFLLGYCAGQVAEARAARERAWRRFRNQRLPWA